VFLIREVHAGFWSQNLKKIEHLKNVREGSFKIYLKEVGWEGIHWIYVVGDRDKCQAVLNMAVNFGVPQNLGNFWTN